MLLRRLALPLLLTACGPKDAGNTLGASEADTSGTSDSAGDDASDTSDTSDISGPGADASDTSGADASAGGGGTADDDSGVTTTGIEPETTNPTAPTTAEDETTAVPITTTDTGDPVGDPSLNVLKVHVLAAENGGNGLDGITRFDPDPALSCPDEEPKQCPGAPGLGAPLVLVDGAFASPDTIMKGSRVALVFPFEQPACALGCGQAALQFELGNGDGFAGTNPLPVDMPCKTASSDVWLAVDLGTVAFPGSHKVELRLVDPCGAESSPRGLIFTPQ